MNFINEIENLTPIGVCLCNQKFEIYSTDIREAPHVVLEIARLRTASFEEAGVVMGYKLDLDSYDVGTRPQSQMFIWDTEKKTIVGGYRYSYNAIILPEHTPMGKYFNFTQKFSNENWIQLGRSFLAVEYKNSRYGIIALMNGLGCLFAKAKDAKGFFGKITIPPVYEENKATDFIASFCKHHWLEASSLGFVKQQYERKISSIVDLAMSHVQFDGNYKELLTLLKKDYQLPGLPILRMYDSLSEAFKSIYYLGAFVHKDFGGSTEIGMAIARENISQTAYKTHIEPYLQ